MFSKKNKKEKRIMIVMNDFIVGGIQKLAIDQMALLGDEYTFTLVTLMQFPRGDFYNKVPANVTIHKLNFKGFFDVGSWAKLVCIVAREKPSIVKTAMFFSNTIMRILKPFFGFVCITAEHNTEDTKPLLHRVFNKILSIFSYTIIADSQTVADFVSNADHIPLKKFTVVYNGVELHDIKMAQEEFKARRDEIRSQIGARIDEPLFLTVARLVKQKDHDLMVRGFAAYKKQGGLGTLVIIGDGVLREELLLLCKSLGVDNNILFLGERQDIYKFYAVSDYFLLTSTREGFCISAMNGLAFGLPLISTKVAGVVEYLKDGENGYFIEHTPESLTSTLQRVVSLPETTQKSLQEFAQETAEAFSVESHVQKYRDLYTRILRD